MKLEFAGKKSDAEILTDDVDITLPEFNEETNKLIYGDNLIALKGLLYKYNLKGKVDLIYIDPPFSTNTVFKAGSRTRTVSMNKNDNVAYEDMITGDDFLAFIRERLVIARELLSDNGSIYLHIDYKIGHYIKLLMDEVFGMENFKNDITRIKCNPKNFNRKAFGNIKDLILFYSKTKNNIWNECYTAYTHDDISKLYKKTKNGRYYTTVPLHAPGETKNGETGKTFNGMTAPQGRHWRCSPSELKELDKQGLIEWSKNGIPRKIIYADEKPGKKVQDIWDFKDPQYPAYPTEKNIDLLKRIIRTSSDENSLVMDFFCGSGTALLAAEQLNRRWIGVDKSQIAIDISLNKLEKHKTIYSRKIEVIKV